MARVDQLYKAWFDVFNDTLLPLMITAHQPKWYSSSDNLKGGDVVYFRKESGVLSGPWTIGMVDTAIRGRDDHVREVDIRYQNSAENKHRITRRSVRSVIRLFNIDEHSWRERLDGILRLAKDTNLPAYAQPDGSPMPESVHLTTPTKSSHCCCTSHHQFCQEGPEPRISYPNWMSQEVYGHLAHIAWTPEDETVASTGNNTLRMMDSWTTSLP